MFNPSRLVGLRAKKIIYKSCDPLILCCYLFRVCVKKKFCEFPPSCLKFILCYFSGQLLDHIKNRVKFTELEASFVIRDLAVALQFLHKKGKFMVYFLHSKKSPS